MKRKAPRPFGHDQPLKPLPRPTFQLLDILTWLGSIIMACILTLNVHFTCLQQHHTLSSVTADFMMVPHDYQQYSGPSTGIEGGLARARELLQQRAFHPQPYDASHHVQIYQQPAPWRQSTTLPQWMKDYFAWHQVQLQAMTADNWRNGTFRFLVVRCVHQDLKCGGTADRLKPLPYYILVANHLKRILMFYWERPAPLEDFLLPPQDGMDWRLPYYMLEHGDGAADSLHSLTPDLPNSVYIREAIGYDGAKPGMKQTSALDNNVVVTLRAQSHYHGSEEYNNLRVQYPPIHSDTEKAIMPVNVARNDQEVELPYADVFRDCWYSVFVPVPQIQRRIVDSMGKLGLHRNQYQAIHMRSRYTRAMPSQVLLERCRNAVHCIYQLDKSKAAHTPIYVSADHRSAVHAILKYSRQLYLTHVTARDAERILNMTTSEAYQDTSTLHIDRGHKLLETHLRQVTVQDYEIEDFYDIFVDLYILSHASCITHFTGNFGRWANLISENITCRSSNVKNFCSAADVLLAS